MAEGAPGKSYLERLYERAVDFNDERISKARAKYPQIKKMREGKYLYRNMPEEIFDMIRNGSKYLELRRKGINGDPKNEINGNISGLFFCANVTYYRVPPEVSPYGTHRILIPIKYMAENQKNDFNLYFADFYCMHPNKEHYVVIMMTRNGSETDQFCKEKLPSLPDDNPFFMYDKGEERFWVTPETWAEILYTDPIDLVDAEKGGNVSYKKCIKIPNAPEARAKNAKCRICNVAMMTKEEDLTTDHEEGMLKTEMKD